MSDEHTRRDAPIETDEHKDELTDQLSDTLAVGAPSDDAPTESQSGGEPILEEEAIKDEIDIQIDLLKDTDWAVRREAVITLGEMGDERCVEPLVRALQDGDWQVREVAIEALGMVGSPAVEPVMKLLRSWDYRKYAIRALGKIKDERVHFFLNLIQPASRDGLARGEFPLDGTNFSDQRVDPSGAFRKLLHLAGLLEIFPRVRQRLCRRAEIA